MMLAMAMVVGTCLSAFASTAKVSDGSVRIRSEASTSGSVVGTGAQGDTFDILETVSGSDGYTWYKIAMSNGSSGYVRGDLVKVSGDTAGGSITTTSTTANSATSLAPTEANPIKEVTATISGNAAVNIRSGAGTGYAKVASLDAGTSITLTGEANDASGNKWYHLKCDSKNVEGYIRSDLINISEDVKIEPANSEGGEVEVTDAEEEPEEPVAEEPQEPEYVETVPENNDYEIVYTTDDDGVYQYYLYDHVNNTRQKVTDLLDAVNTLNTKYQDASSKASTFKVIAILCGVLAVVFLILMIIFIIRSNNANNVEYYEGDFEDDDDDDEDYEDDDDDDYVPSRRSGRPAPRVEDSPRSPRQERPAQTPQRRPRKAQNFLADDDEFEFEFLNMDDRD